MHGAAFAAAVAGFLTEQLGEHSVDGCALGNTMAMAAVCTGDVIVLAQRFTDTDRDRFMDGSEAVKYGLVDGLLDKRGDLAPKPAAKA